MVKVLKILGIKKSTFYYKRKVKTQKKKYKKEDEKIYNEIKKTFENEFNNYGYRKITVLLKNNGFHINKKKVYRIMKENNVLLKKKTSSIPLNKKFVNIRKMKAEKPLNCFQMDIKYIYIHSVKRNAFLLAVIDIFTRKIVSFKFAFSVTQSDVCDCVHSFIKSESISHPFTIRTDNGPQFNSHSFAAFCSSFNINHEFTHFATPKEDAFIESFFSIVQSDIVNRFFIDSFSLAFNLISDFIFHYNHFRPHSSLSYKSPVQFISDFSAFL